ncbi:conserved hypothetical protein [Candidatus Terasakiella magnetica]|nr:conserved hypothetical protein [Candidatus Terasakiella magnetica]
MNDGFHFLDIVFFAMVAVFLVLRLRSVLGKRTGTERPPERWAPADEAKSAKVIDLDSRRRSVFEPAAGSAAATGLDAVRAADATFDLDVFLGGARAAFEMIVQAFASGDKATLKPLLAPDVFGHFAAAIDTRLSNGEILKTELVGFRKVDLADVRMEGSFASLTVRFVSEQINLLRGKDGQIIEGSADRVVDVIDEWTFRRDTRSSDPNWALAATHSPEV